MLRLQEKNMDDPIESLLKTTGLSCDDLLRKLQQYKQLQTATEDKEVKTKEAPKVEKPVIAETKCSVCLDNSNNVNNDTAGPSTDRGVTGLDLIKFSYESFENSFVEDDDNSSVKSVNCHDIQDEGDSEDRIIKNDVKILPASQEMSIVLSSDGSSTQASLTIDQAKDNEDLYAELDNFLKSIRTDKVNKEESKEAKYSNLSEDNPLIIDDSLDCLTVETDSSSHAPVGDEVSMIEKPENKNSPSSVPIELDKDLTLNEDNSLIIDESVDGVDAENNAPSKAAFGATSKESPSKVKNASAAAAVASGPSGYTQVFDGEIKVSIKDNQKVLHFIGKENENLEYIRILPWDIAVRGYRSGKINIWTEEYPSSSLLCNTGEHTPPKNFEDIKQINNKTEMIKWILSGKLPENRPDNLMHLMLTPERNHFLISGYCLKNERDKVEPLDIQYIVTSEGVIEICDSPARNLNSQLETIASPTSTPSSEIPSMPLNKNKNIRTDKVNKEESKGAKNSNLSEDNPLIIHESLDCLTVERDSSSHAAVGDEDSMIEKPKNENSPSSVPIEFDKDLNLNEDNSLIIDESLDGVVAENNAPSKAPYGASIDKPTKESPSKVNNTSAAAAVASGPSEYTQVFDGEIKVSIKDNQDMLHFIGKKNENLEYIRILPWDCVVRGYRSGKINIWTREYRSSPLLCNTGKHTPPKSFEDIKQINNKTEIIKWILSGKLPENRPDNLMLVLTPTKNHFLISGYCLNNERDIIGRHPETITVETCEVGPPDNLNCQLKTIASPTSSGIPSMPLNKSLRCTHKNIRTNKVNKEESKEAKNSNLSEDNPLIIHESLDCSPSKTPFDASIEKPSKKRSLSHVPIELDKGNNEDSKLSEVIGESLDDISDADDAREGDSLTLGVSAKNPTVELEQDNENNSLKIEMSADTNPLSRASKKLDANEVEVEKSSKHKDSVVDKPKLDKDNVKKPEEINASVEVDVDDHVQTIVTEEKAKIEDSDEASVENPPSEDKGSGIDVEDVDDDDSSLSELSRSGGNLHDILRMQLSSLRNMKRVGGHVPDVQNKPVLSFHMKKKRKSTDVKSFSALKDDVEEEHETERNESPVAEMITNFHSLKKKLESTVVNVDAKDPVVAETITQTLENTENAEISHEKTITQEDSLFSLTDETQFIISEVTGGLDRLSPMNEDNEERRFSSITDETDKSDYWKSSNKDFVKNILHNHRKKMSLNYFSETSYNIKNIHTTTKASQINEDRVSNIQVRQDQNFSEDPGVSKPVKNSEKSPFVSDSLDDFLNESSALKISYPIPKLGAEEGCNESSKASPYVNKTVSTKYESGEPETPAKSQPKLFKAKTLAEMRRNLEKLNKKRTKSDKDQQRTDDDLLEKPETETPVSPHRNSFIIYNEKKIWLPSKARNKHITTIEKGKTNSPRTSPPQKPSVCNRRPSLLSALIENSSPTKIKYKPGPLSAKARLQFHNNTWVTEIKELPHVYLEIQTELGKEVDPKIKHMLPIFDDPVISAERAGFAVSTVITPNPTPKGNNPAPDVRNIFKFRVSYKNNQDKFVVRRRQRRIRTSTVSEGDTKLTEDVVKSVVNDLVDYVELKEISHTFIKDDEDLTRDAPEKPEENKSPDNRKKKKIDKKKRLNLELQRLNCKIIDVASTAVEDRPCVKTFCKLGCVCKSLACDTIFSNHCQEVDCMFGCKCPTREMSIINSDSLSPYTINNLEDKVNRNLARVEREFIQTVIHTDNDTILVGPGGRNKTRRACKVPKKYTDYIEDIDLAADNNENKVKEREISLPPEDDDNTVKFNLKKCGVDLVKYNLDDVIPYCMSHKMYNCYCRRKVMKTVPKLKVIKTREGKFLTLPQEDASKAKPEVANKLEKTEKEIPAARARPVLEQYRIRNKDPTYNKRLKSLRTPNNSQKEAIIVDDLPELSSIQTVKPGGSSKRKQSFDIRTDDVVFDVSDHAMQRRKKKKKENNASAAAAVASNPTGYTQVFDGEIKVSMKDNQDMLRIIGKENEHLEYIRILPWDCVVRGYHSGKINIWTREFRSSSLLCNTGKHTPPKNFEDIKQINNKTEIINWILSGKLPEHRPNNLMHLVLTPKKNHFLISGYCLKNEKDIIGRYPETITVETCEVEPPDTQNIVTSEGVIEICDSPARNLNSQLKTIASPTSTPSSGIPSMPLNKSLRCTHKNMNNESKTLIVCNREFGARKLYFRDSHDGDVKHIEVRLPKVDFRFKWRMFYLNSDFSYLSFSAAQYSIKYTDMMDLLKLSNNVRSTITLRNNEFCKHYEHPIFGIFCVPDYDDRLFIGPFWPTEKHKVETLRYMQGSLVDTELFNKMLGKTANGKSPVWLYETDSGTEPRDLNGLCIDITEDDDGVEEVPVAGDFVNENLFGPPFVEVLTSHNLVARTVNRYFLTNVPHLGYFPAYQWENKAIDVFWPTGDKGFKFPNVTFAKHSLVQFLHQIFVTVPEDFKISVVILTHLDLASNKPINSKYLATQGTTYICGEFGVYNKKNIPEDYLSRYKISLDNLISNSREEQNTTRIVRLFALFLMNNEDLRNYTETKDILQWATSEVYVLNKMIEQAEQQVNDLKQLLSTNEEKLKLLRIAVPHGSTNDLAQIIALDEEDIDNIIEVPDSDEEDPLFQPVVTRPVPQTKSSSSTVTAASSSGGVGGYHQIRLGGRLLTGIVSTIKAPSESDRSVLKRNYQLGPGQSLLKITEEERNTILKKSPVKISLVNKNNTTITVNKANMKILPRTL